LAAACGGCFAPPDVVTAVDSHRMVIALSAEQTILWDQIVYTGNPKDFVWVLPVPTPNATIATADPVFFLELDAATAPTVSPRPLVFNDDSGGLGCGDSDDSAPLGDSPIDDGVTIYDEQVVGPYQTVTIGSEDGDALQNWLVENGYRVTESTVPTIDHYVELGSVFIVMRLAPGEGVQSMQPVRVSYPGYMASFPLEMVTVGASGRLGLLLWVYSEQRYQAWNYDNAIMDPGRLVFDWTTSTSNYAEAFAATIEEAGGRAWVTEYAHPADYVGTTFDERLISSIVRFPYLTRLRTSMLVDHIDEDLILVPAADPSDVWPDLVAGMEIGRPFDDSAAAADEGCRVGRRSRAGGYLFALLMVLIGDRLLRRRR
jgi:hypothetical protein